MTMNMNTHHERKAPSIVKLVSWQRWHHLRDVLEAAEAADAAGDDQAQPVFDDRARNRLPEEHILHLAVQHQAPLQIVDLLHRRYPASVATPENKGRYPVHIACAKGLSPKVIDFLIQRHPTAAALPDSFGKTPLHYCCESYAYNFKTIPTNSFRAPDKSMMTAVALLLEIAPESANLDDFQDMNSIEYAIESDADIRIIKAMQNASRENWREMAKRHRDKSHDELRRSMSSLSSSMNSLNVTREEMEAIMSQETKAEEEKEAGANSPAQGIGAPELKMQAARTA